MSLSRNGSPARVVWTALLLVLGAVVGPVVHAGHCYVRDGEAACTVPPVGGQAGCAFCNGRCQMQWDTCTKAIACDPAKPETCAGYFVAASDEIDAASNPQQRNYGVAITDVDGDGLFDAFVGGYSSASSADGSAANLVLSWDAGQGKLVNIAPSTMPATTRKTLGVTACDVDGDGAEEIYLLNLDSYAGGGTSAATDQLLTRSPGTGGFEDMLADPRNAAVMNRANGRSVACLDRHGNGSYSIFVSNYASAGTPKPMLVELGAAGALRDVAPELGMDRPNGGRAVVTGQLFDERVSIFVNNEGGSYGNSGENFLYAATAADGGGFEEDAGRRGVADSLNTGRGTIMMDANGDGMLDLVWGNWNCNHKLMLQQSSGKFLDAAPEEMKEPSPIRTVVAADWDNDGYEEIFYNNIPGANRLFSVFGDPEKEARAEWAFRDLGDAAEPNGYGTGAGVADFDGDGRLELLISHGESDPSFQGVTLYRAAEGAENHWIRVMPLTLAGAPARGALVQLTMLSGRVQTRSIDAGSGYLCVQEPVAHFGLGKDTEYASIMIRWPGYAKDVVLDGGALEIDTFHKIPHIATPPPPPHVRGAVAWSGSEVADLHDQYLSIFTVAGNRNAASHLWAGFILDRAEALTHSVFVAMFSGFCPVSGSPIRAGRPPYGIELKTVLGQAIAGFVYFCCWPCVCDTTDMIKVDTKTVATADGPRQYNFLVIGDPCSDPSKIPFHGTLREQKTPEISCSNGKAQPGTLENAFRSDHGYVIIGMLQEEVLGGSTGSWTEAVGAVASDCAARAVDGYRSGMGTIFREVAGVAIPASGPKESHPAFAATVSPRAPSTTMSAAAVATGATVAVTANPACTGIIPADTVSGIAAAIAGNQVAVFGVKNARCTAAAESALNSRSICFHTTHFEMTDAMWDYFKCLHPEEKVGSTLMHSFVYIGGALVGNGFRLLLDQNDYRCTDPGGKPCLSACDLNDLLGAADAKRRPCPQPVTVTATSLTTTTVSTTTATSVTTATMTTSSTTTTTRIVDCAYTLSNCTSSCEPGSERTIEVTRSPTADGNLCPTAAELPSCMPGDGDCPTTTLTSSSSTSASSTSTSTSSTVSAISTRATKLRTGATVNTNTAKLTSDGASSVTQPATSARPESASTSAPAFNGGAGIADASSGSSGNKSETRGNATVIAVVVGALLVAIVGAVAMVTLKTSRPAATLGGVEPNLGGNGHRGHANPTYDTPGDGGTFSPEDFGGAPSYSPPGPTSYTTADSDV